MPKSNMTLPFKSKNTINLGDCEPQPSSLKQKHAENAPYLKESINYPGKHQTPDKKNKIDNV